MKPWENQNDADIYVSNISELEGDTAKLASAAPEMARLLLELHREHGDRHTFDWAYWFTEIEAVLKKAGVPYEDVTTQRHGDGEP